MKSFPCSVMPRLIRSAAIGATVVAAMVAPVAALPIVSDLNAVMNRAAAPPIVLVRDICGVHYEGRTKVTRYCDPPYVCDRANPGKCKPGAALQRQLDAGRQRREDALRAAQQRLDQMRRDIDARVRNLRRSTRTTSFARTGNIRANDRRASGCNWEQNLGSRVLYCQDKGRLSNNAYNDRIIPSPQYGRARPPQGRPVYGAVRRTAPAAPNSRPPSLRARTTLAIMVRDLYQMEPNDPDRAEQQRKIIVRAKEFEALGETIAPALKEIIDDAAQDAAEREQRKRGPVTDTPPPPPPETPAVPPQAAADPPKPYSDKDETLCSYLMTLAPDRRDDAGRMTRLGQPVPDYCQPYLRSLKQPDEVKTAEAVPAFHLPERDKEEACKQAEEFYRDNVLPPNYADLDAPDRGDFDRRASKCLTAPK